MFNLNILVFFTSFVKRFTIHIKKCIVVHMDNCEAIKILSEQKADEDKNVCLIECLKYEDVEFFNVGKTAVCFTLKNSGLTMLGGEADGLNADGIPLSVKNYFTPDKDIAEIIKRKTCRTATPCVQVLYRAADIKIPSGVTIGKLNADKKTAEFVAERYTLHYSADEVLQILNERVMLAAYVNGEMAGFIGMHEERSVGMLEVFDKFRRMGLGTLLINEMIKYFWQNGFKPFCHIIATNEKSLNLHKKMDCDMQKDLVYWL